MLFAMLPRSLPVVRVESETVPIRTLNGGNVHQLPSGWSVFVAHTRGASALLRPDGRVAIRGAWCGSGRFPGGFNGVIVGFDGKRAAGFLSRAGAEVAAAMPPFS